MGSIVEEQIDWNNFYINRSDHYQHGIILHYYPVDKIKWREFHEYIIKEVYKPLGLEPHRATASGGEFGSPRLTVTYKALVKKLEAHDYRIERSLNFIVIRPEFLKDKNVNEYLSDSNLRSGVCGFGDQPKDAHVKFFISEDVLPFNYEYFCQMAIRLQEITGAMYGYYLRQPNSCDPRRYAFGRDLFSTTVEEYERNIKWEQFKSSEETREHIHKYLRDIYKINFLSKIHIELEVAPGQTLEEWIKAGSPSQRGIINQVSPNLWAWYIENETQIPTIRHHLTPSNIIICT